MHDMNEQDQREQDERLRETIGAIVKFESDRVTPLSDAPKVLGGHLSWWYTRNSQLATFDDEFSNFRAAGADHEAAARAALQIAIEGMILAARALARAKVGGP
jgi:hypothetical protein